MTTLFLADVDGTLIKTGHPPHARVIAAVARFAGAGGYFALASGRAVSAIRGIAAGLVINAPCILCNGAVLYDSTRDEILQAEVLDNSVLDLLAAVWAKYPQVSITEYTRDTIYNVRLNSRLTQKGVLADRTAPLTPQKEIPRELVKLLFTCDDVAVLEEIRQQHVDPAHFECTAASTHFYELTAKGVNKGTVAQKLCGRLADADGCRLFAAGDGHTDLAMQRIAQAFYAPVTAGDAVKQKAAAIFAPPIEGGLAEVIDQCAALL